MIESNETEQAHSPSEMLHEFHIFSYNPFPERATHVSLRVEREGEVLEDLRLLDGLVLLLVPLPQRLLHPYRRAVVVAWKVECGGVEKSSISRFSGRCVILLPPS